MTQQNLSQNVRKIFWWLGCFFSALISFPIILLSLLLVYLAFSPIDVSGLGKRFIGTFYINSKGDLTPVKKKAVGKEVWEKLKIQWVMPSFSDWLRHQNVGDIGFSLSGVKLVDLQGNEIDHLHRVEGKIAIALFSEGKVAVKSLAVEGLELRLKKLKTGEVILDFPGVHKNPNPSKPIDLSFLNRDLFQSLQLQNVHLALSPEGEDHFAEFRISDLHLQNFSENNEIGKWEGKFWIFAKDGGKEASIVGIRQAAKAKAEKNWQVKIDLPAPQDFADILPIMDKIHLPIKAEVTGEPMLCALGFKGCHLDFNLAVGEGYYTQPDNSKMLVLNAFGEGHVAWEKDYKNLQADVPKLEVMWIDSFGKKTKEYLQATLGLDNLAKPHQTNLSIGGRLPHFNIASLPTLWPQGLSNGARKWIVENLTAGQADNFTLKVALEGNEGFDHLRVQEIGGALEAKNVTVHWLDDMPPFRGVSVSAKFLDSDDVLVEMAGGTIDENPKALIKLSKGSVAIRGVTSHKQIAGRINLGLSGSAPKLVEILSRDRLPILKRFQKYYTNPQGSFNGKLMLDLPFAPWITADDIIFESAINTPNLAVNLREIGQVSAFNGVLKARNRDVRIKAKALVRHLPIEMDLYDDLTANKPGQDMLKVHLTTPVNQTFLHRIGIPLSAERVSGKGLLQADIFQPWSEKDHNQTDMVLNLDMRGCGVQSLLWNKTKNIPAGGKLRASWVDDKLASVTDVTAYGPEIEVQANTLLKNHHINGIDVTHIKIGKNEGRFRFEWPLITEEDAVTSVKTTSQKYILAVNASKIDLEPFLKHTSTEMQDTLKGKKLSGTAQPVIKRKNGRTILPAGHWDINWQVEKAFLGQGRILGPLSILAHWNKGHLKRADIEIEKPYKAFLKVSHSKDRKEEHFFEGGTDHLGEWLAWAKIYDALKGGKVSVSGKFAPSIEVASVSDPLVLQIEKDRKYYKRKKHRKEIFLKEKPEKEPEKPVIPEEKTETPLVHTEGLGLGLPPYAGKVSVEGMDWNSSLTGILLAKILSPTHWNAVNGNLSGISISGAVSVQDGIIGFGNIQGNSDILTATMVGNINLKKAKIALGGTVSPDYYWNSSLGRLPSVLGYIFSPQKGSGILAMGYTLDGELSQPHFNLNPYMMLLPGILRKIANPNI